MVALPNAEFHQLVPLLREQGFSESRERRLSDWAAYTQAQVDEVAGTRDFVRKRVDEAKYLPDLPVPGTVGRPLTDPKLLATAILLAEFLRHP